METAGDLLFWFIFLLMGEETFLKGGITYSGDAKNLVLIYLKIQQYRDWPLVSIRSGNSVTVIIR